MEIYKGEKYIITTDGITAHKTDGHTTRSMNYYPERDLSAIAGEINEHTAWQILHDVAQQASGGTTTPLSPDHIFIDKAGFVVSEWSASVDERFTAPEGYSDVWALAATVFNIYLGCHVFQGLGGKGQRSSTPIPTLRKELPQLSRLLATCLDYTPSNRPTMEEIAVIAQENLERCKSAEATRPSLKKNTVNDPTHDDIDALWPEEMY